MLVRAFDRLRRVLAVSVLAVSGAAGCADPAEIVLPTVDIVGSYVATRFVVTPTGQPSIDVLARGGSLTVQITADKSTTGSLIVPQDVFGSAQNVSLVGFAAQLGRSVQFQQPSADSFLEQVGWLAGDDGSIATDSNDGSARIEVVLTRQGG